MLGVQASTDADLLMTEVWTLFQGGLGLVVAVALLRVPIFVWQVLILARERGLHGKSDMTLALDVIASSLAMAIVATLLFMMATDSPMMAT